MATCGVMVNENGSSTASVIVELMPGNDPRTIPASVAKTPSRMIDGEEKRSAAMTRNSDIAWFLWERHVDDVAEDAINQGDQEHRFQGNLHEVAGGERIAGAPMQGGAADQRIAKAGPDEAELGQQHGVNHR